jgi:hypothetical protein
LPEINREECIMKMSAKRVVLLMGIVLLLDANLVLAAPVDDDATASITVTVADIMEWSGNFSTIALPDITTQTSAPTGSQTTILYTNGNVDITADNTTAAQLSLGADPNQTLVTSYMLTDDGDGINTTGGTDETSYTMHSSFLSPTAYIITHVAGDGAVVITLHAEAKNPSGEVADAGSYSAIQTLTAAWGTQ